MAVEWSGLGPEVLIRLYRARRGTLGAQLQQALRDAVRSGRLGAGERLPSTRELARALEISRGLAQESYEQLVAEGYLIARPGSATRVAATRDVPPRPAGPSPAPALDVDFASGVPDLARFPMRDWLWALGEAGRAAPLDVAAYGDAAGRPELRAVLAAYLRRVRAAAAAPESIVICNGFTQCLQLVLQVLADEGHHVVGVEDPGHRDWAAIAERQQLRPSPVPVDGDGVRIGAAAPAVRVVVVTPAHQIPTGVLLAPERRHEIVSWTEDRDAVAIEDDYDAEFRYDRQAVGALQGLAPDRVFLIGSVSKVLGPALRLGWVVCPPEHRDAVAHAKRLADRGTPALDQLALARLIESGRYDRHLRRMRALYARKREALIAALAEHAPAVEVSGLAAGFHAVARLPAGADESAVAQAARERGVGVYPMARYRLEAADHPPQLVLGFGNLSEGAIRRGVATIGDLLDRPTASGRPAPGGSEVPC